VTFPATIEIAGAQHVARLPSLAVREQIASAWHEFAASGDRRLLLLAGAIVGACTGLGGITLAKAGYDLLAYGDACYSALREQGVSTERIVAVATDLIRPLTEHLFPRESEVSAAAGFSVGGEAEPTSPRSA
jgi:hypothetical protein